MSKGLLRVILVAMVALFTVSNAGWFGFGDDKDKAKKQKSKPKKEDTVEYDPTYEEREGKKKPKKEEKKEEPNDDYNNMSYAQARRKRQEKVRKEKAAKNVDEMISTEFNERMLEDDVIEETHTPDENLDGYLSDEDINRIWQEHMHDFVPEDMTNVIVEKKTTEALFETINHVEPTAIKGAYYVLGGSKEKTISCVVYDPNREIVFKRRGSAQGIILFNSTIPGEYAFIFSNSRSGVDLTVTLALHTYEAKEEQVKFDITTDGKRHEIKPQVQEFDPVQTKEEILGGEENLAVTEEEVSVVRGKLRDIQVSIK